MHDKRRTRAESGQAMVLFVILIPVLILVAALAFEPSRLGNAGEVLQEAADAAALAGARALSDTVVTEAVVRSRVHDIAARNDVHSAAGGASGSLVLSLNLTNTAGGDIVLGGYDSTTRIFTPATVPVDMTAVNAVQVNAHLSGTGSWTPTAFGQFAGLTSKSLTRTATAALSAPSISTPNVPIAVDPGDFAGLLGNLSTPVPVTFSPSSSDIEWTGFTLGHNASLVSGFITNPATIPQVTVGETVDTTNGVMASAWHDLAAANLVGKTVVLAVTHLSGAHQGEVVGFAALKVTSIVDHGSQSSLSGDLVQYTDATPQTANASCFGYDCTPLLR